ncbi:MAG: hypothetical protein RLZZ453_1240 [Chlamydiota bacterium]|jgi:hypothetical protein
MKLDNDGLVKMGAGAMLGYISGAGLGAMQISERCAQLADTVLAQSCLDVLSERIHDYANVGGLIGLGMGGVCAIMAKQSGYEHLAKRLFIGIKAIAIVVLYSMINLMIGNFVRS